MKFVIAAFVLIAGIYGAYEGFGKNKPISYTIAGLLTGVVLAVIVWIFSWLFHQFRTKAPRIAKYTGLTIFWIGLALCLYILGLTTYAAYRGAPLHVLVELAQIAAVYLAIALIARFGLVRAI